MSKILTPEQVVALVSYPMALHPSPPQIQQMRTNIRKLRDSHEALRTDRDSWQATAEELDAKNVNKALAARHEMREASLKKQITELKVALNEKEIHDGKSQ